MSNEMKDETCNNEIHENHHVDHDDDQWFFQYTLFISMSHTWYMFMRLNLCVVFFLSHEYKALKASFEEIKEEFLVTMKKCKAKKIRMRRDILGDQRRTCSFVHFTTRLYTQLFMIVFNHYGQTLDINEGRVSEYFSS